MRIECGQKGGGEMSGRTSNRRLRRGWWIAFAVAAVLGGVTWWGIASSQTTSRQHADEQRAMGATETLRDALRRAEDASSGDEAVDDAIAAFDLAVASLAVTPVTLASRIEGLLAITDALRMGGRSADAAGRLRDARNVADVLVAHDPRPAPRRLAVDTILRSAQLTYLGGDTTRTLALVGEARAGLDLLPAEATDEPPSLDLRRQSHLIEGQTRMARRETERGIASFEQAATIARTMMRQSESTAAAEAGLQSLRYLSVAYEVAGRLEEARAAHAEAIRVAEEQHARQPGSWFDLSIAYRGFHSFLAEHGDADEARTHIERALALDRTAAATSRDGAAMRSHLVDTLRVAAAFEREQGRPQEALAHLGEGAAEVEAALRTAPESIAWRLARATSRLDSARALGQLGRNEDARTAADEALVVLESLRENATTARTRVYPLIGDALAVQLAHAVRDGTLDDADRRVARWLELETAMLAAAPAVDRADAALESIRIIAQFVAEMSGLTLDAKVAHQLPVLRALRSRIVDFAGRGPEVQPDVARLRPLFVDVELTIAALTQGVDREAGGP